MDKFGYVFEILRSITFDTEIFFDKLKQVWSSLVKFEQVCMVIEKLGHCTDFKQDTIIFSKGLKVWTSLDKFEQVWTSLNKFGRVWTHLVKFNTEHMF